MLRLMLHDELWFKLKEIMLHHGIYDKPNLRMIGEAMLYRMRVGCPWRDLPTDFGCWNSIYQPFNRWSSKNKLMRIFKTFVQEPDLEWSFIDRSIVKAHPHSANVPNKEEQGIGKSVAGNTTKIHMAVDAHGLPIDFEITGGEVQDCHLMFIFLRVNATALFMQVLRQTSLSAFGSTKINLFLASLPNITDTCCVYYEAHELYMDAARREKRFKNWPRQWKLNLIEKLNPEWLDLYEEICQ